MPAEAHPAAMVLDDAAALAELCAMWERQRQRCAICGTEFTAESKEPDVLCRPKAPSFDRIDHRINYRTPNLRIVHVQYNFAPGPVVRRIAYRDVQGDPYRAPHDEGGRGSPRKAGGLGFE